MAYGPSLLPIPIPGVVVNAKNTVYANGLIVVEVNGPF